jgi:hypothetical protein
MQIMIRGMRKNVEVVSEIKGEVFGWTLLWGIWIPTIVDFIHACTWFFVVVVFGLHIIVSVGIQRFIWLIAVILTYTI